MGSLVAELKRRTVFKVGVAYVTVPLETSAKPFFELLGTPADRKKHVVAPGGHFVPHVTLIKESLDWLDRYLGPVH